MWNEVLDDSMSTEVESISTTSTSSSFERFFVLEPPPPPHSKTSGFTSGAFEDMTKAWPRLFMLLPLFVFLRRRWAKQDSL